MENKYSSRMVFARSVILRYSFLLLLFSFLHRPVSSSSLNYMISYTRDQLRDQGWSIIGTNPVVYDKPSDFRAALAVLDDSVQGGSVWRVTATNPTRFVFRGFTGDADYCNVKSARVHMKYFSEMATVGISPCQGTYCYADPPANVQWTRVSYTLDHERLWDTEIELLIHITPGPGGYIFFDQLTIEYDGVDCSSTPTTTTEKSTTPDYTDAPTSEGTPQPTTETTSEEPETEPQPTTTDRYPECPTPEPEPCNCCDRCASKNVQEIHHIHHHYYYYYPASPDASESNSLNL